MACKYCHKIRSLLLHGKMAEAAGVTVEKLRESIGWKEKEKALNKQATEFTIHDGPIPDGMVWERVPLSSVTVKGVIAPDSTQDSHPELSARPETTKRKPKP